MAQPYANISKNGDSRWLGNDSIVIVDVVDTLAGGRTISPTDWVADFIPAGHPIIRETATNTYKPLPVTGTALAALPADHEYVGILINSVTKDMPFGGVLIHGTVNPNAMLYTGWAGISAAFKTAVPHILFQVD